MAEVFRHILRELARGEIDRHRVVRRLRLAAVGGRMVLDAQLCLRHDDAQISVVAVIVALEDDLVGRLGRRLQDLRRAQHGAAAGAQPLQAVSMLPHTTYGIWVPSARVRVNRW